MDLLIKTGNFASHFKKMRRDYRGNCQLANEYNWPRDREFDEIVKDRQLFESKLVAFMKPDKGKSWKGKIPEFNRVLTDEEKKVIEELHTEMRTLVRALEHVLYTLRQQRKDATCYPPRMVWTSGWFEGTYCDDCDFMVAASDSVNWKRDIERGRYQEDDCYDMSYIQDLDVEELDRMRDGFHRGLYSEDQLEEHEMSKEDCIKYKVQYPATMYYLCHG